MTIRILSVPLLFALLVFIAPLAEAGIEVPLQWTPSSRVGDSVTDEGNGAYTYEYEVFNTSTSSPSDFFDEVPQGIPVIVDWELPWFGDAGIDTNTITSPDSTSWTWSIETIGQANSTTGWGGIAAWQTPGDLFYNPDPNSPFNTATEVLHWYSLDWAQGGALGDGILPEDSLSGFSFIANFAAVPAPYQASWDFQEVISGDPAFPLGRGAIPGSPLATGAAPNPVPEPSTVLLLGSGLVGLAYLRRRRNSQR